MKLGTDISTNKDIHISDDALRRHLHILGRSGTGKSVLLENAAIDRAEQGWGFCLIDIHGAWARKVADSLPDTRFWTDAYYWEPYEDAKIGINPLKDIPIGQRPVVADNIVSVFAHVFGSGTKHERTFYDEKEEDVLRNALRLLMDSNLSLIELQKVITDMSFRERLLRRVTDAKVAEFWTVQFDTWNERQVVEYTAGLMSKLGTLTGNPAVRRALEHDGIDPLAFMNSGKILIINLSKGKLGELSARFLGALIATVFGVKAYERDGMAEEDMQDFALFIDECQNFLTTSLAGTVAEARKYHLTLITANQYLDQLSPSLQSAIIGTVGNFVVFRCGSDDAERMAKELDPFSPQRLQDLSRHHAAVKREDAHDVVEILTDPPRQARGRLEAVKRRTKSRLTRP